MDWVVILALGYLGLLAIGAVIIGLRCECLRVSAFKILGVIGIEISGILFICVNEVFWILFVAVGIIAAIYIFEIWRPCTHD